MSILKPNFFKSLDLIMKYYTKEFLKNLLVTKNLLTLKKQLNFFKKQSLKILENKFFFN